jgi:hypothetical protein
MSHRTFAAPTGLRGVFQVTTTRQQANAKPRLGDIARQFAVVFAAIFQIYASYVGGASVGAIAQENRSLILPASYAFAIWGPIFLLCGLYAIYQALPAQRENPIFRGIGWWTAAAFAANGAWIYAYTSRQFVLAQAIIVAGFVFAGGAYLRFTRPDSGENFATIQRWVVGPALGLLFGWLTAANIVGLAGTLVAQGFAATGRGAEIGGAALLLLGGAVAFFVILVSKRGSEAAWIAYGAAMLWALAAIIVAQRSASTVTTGAAAVGAILVLAAMVGPWHAPSRSAEGLRTV